MSLLLASVTVHGQTLLRLDASGSPGVNGQDGRGYSTSPGASNGRGSDGANATPSTEGQSAGRIQLRVQDFAPEGQTVPARILVTGTVNGRQVQNELQVVPNGHIILNAVGGQGGRGGGGGDGQGGCNGHNGSDATRSSRGSNGTNGCNGGAGGSATKGSDGGAGGDIVVQLSAQDLHLALMVQSNVRGGEGGQGSKNGRGGSGGRGGRGGNSISWTTNEYAGTRQVPYQESVSRSRTVSRSNGNGTYSTSTEYYTEYVTRYRTEDVYQTRHHSNPGGLDGSSGNSGSDGRGSTSPGSRGAHGNFRFVVQGEDGHEEIFEQAFQLQLVSYDFEDEDRNGIFEPGERVRVYNLKVRNASRMPSPGPKAKILTILANSSWVVANPQALEIPALKGLEARSIPGELIFTVKNNRLAVQAERATVQDTIVPMAHIQRIRSYLDTYQLPKTFTIGYPIELTSFSTAESLGPGESAPLVWKIRNLSSKDIGLSSSLARAIEVGLKRAGGDANPGSVKFYAPDGQLTGHEDGGFSTGIPLIKAGETLAVEGRLQVAKDAVPYTRYGFSTLLNLQPFNGGAPEATQQRDLNLRIAQTYQFNPKAQVLVVTNRNTSRQQIEALKRRLDQLGITFDLWDYSYYGFFALTKDLAINGNRSLLSSYEGRTIVLLGEVGSGVSERDALLEQVTAEDFARAATDSGINFLAVGADRSKLESYIRSRVLPQKALIHQIVKSDKELLKLVQGEQADQLNGIGFSVETDQKLASHRDLGLVLKARAAEMVKSLKKSQPGHRYFVTYNIDLKTLQKDGKVASQVGQILLYRTFDNRMGKLTAAVVNAQALSSDGLFDSSEFTRSLYASMGAGQKAAILAGLGEGLDSSARASLRASIVSDLLQEQDDLATLKLVKADTRELNGLFASSAAEGFLPALNRADLMDVLASVYFYSDYLDSSARREYQEKFFAGLNTLRISKDKFLQETAVTRTALSQQVKQRSAALIGYTERVNAYRMLTLPVYYRIVKSSNIVERELRNPFELRWEQMTGEL